MHLIGETNPKLKRNRRHRGRFDDQITIRLTGCQRDFLDGQAARYGISRGEYLRLIVENVRFGVDGPDGII